MIEIVFLLEEPSAKAMIQGILPKIILELGIVVRYIVFSGKQDLEKQITRKLQGYNNPHARFIILRDQDSGDCQVIKTNLQEKCEAANKFQSIVRIACRELESWYIADLEAVEKAYNKTNLSSQQNKNKFRNPDNLESPSKELKSLVPEYQKINGSRMIAPYLNLENTRSRSFYHFISSIKKVIQEYKSENDIVELQHLDFEISLTDIYQDVNLEDKE
ncbi:MAG: DUF4276 family protein [Nostocales cyanobacterium LE14-WE4]|jgi:hypothetical protein|uniref:DUF4276 family protein n=1 Tax=Anabaena sp. AL09 TaxID=1710891 RepID=UPI000AB017B4|nr:DUF4276 family protein [Anabaena sp. AL09]MCE2701391.1 DUF4276 family protein [Anabaena sp. 49633_E8]MDJ0500685.1 DUF4276 family protein [Nostocales cyanobacterium LE14-WE4]